MCGIIVVAGKNVNSKLIEIQVGLEELQKRGPDEQGIVAKKECILGHTRLAIVNPNSGSQPMMLNDWTLSINGEIYNCDDFIEKKDNSDCDAILKLLDNGEDPNDFLPKIDGMFSFVAYNDKTNQIIVAKDHIGITPLYIGFDEHKRLWISSLLNAMPFSIDKPRIVKPGTCEKYFIKNNKVELDNITKWLKPYPKTGFTEDPDYDKIRTLLFDAVKKRVNNSDVPWGCLLSGGLDSSIVTALACKVKRKDYPSVHTFSIGLEDSPDLKVAQKVADYLGTIHHPIVFTIEEGLVYLPKVIKNLESYDVTSIRCAVPNTILARAVRNYGIKTVLSGEGADEILSGYSHFGYCPNESEMVEECIDKLESLWAYDCNRLNKSMLSQSVEARVPFLSKDFVDYVMRDLKPIHKFSRSHPDGPRIEKYILREAFKDELPECVYSRKKAQFSDAVSKGWIASLKEYAEKEVSDEEYNQRESKFPINTPGSKEAYLYRKIFEEKVKVKDTSDCLIYTHKSISCSTERAIQWHESFSKNLDPSGDIDI